ncbi:hypothetical protein CFOL_v3_13740 [Cephalotus follicularis]|uniref:Uncharacterized protein n=1 Tax=Cephalotus follicularis TaxID=3775 RepID=A0A1Q3BQW8_CEPFO|nr:hypothetical protein CFOL_v3_13740 [Cephalotus follicularis]
MTRMQSSKRKRIATVAILCINMYQLLLTMMFLLTDLFIEGDGNAIADSCEDIARDIERDFVEGIATGGLSGNVGIDKEVVTLDASTKKRKRSKADVTGHLIGNMDRMADNIAMLVNCFKH